MQCLVWSQDLGGRRDGNEDVTWANRVPYTRHHSACCIKDFKPQSAKTQNDIGVAGLTPPKCDRRVLHSEIRQSNIDLPINMSSADTPSSSELKAAAAKEAAEQATLPYKWAQTIAEVDISVPVPPGTRARDLIVEIKSQSIKVGLKGKEPILEVYIYLPYSLIFDATDIETILSHGFKRL